MDRNLPNSPILAQSKGCYHPPDNIDEFILLPAHVRPLKNSHSSTMPTPTPIILINNNSNKGKNVRLGTWSLRYINKGVYGPSKIILVYFIVPYMRVEPVL